MPPPDFVARRNALVRELKADGRSDDAKAVGALRRPRLSEYALNAAVRENDALGQRFATAVAHATAAQSAAIGGGGGADAMRVATRELRAATTALTEAAGRQIVGSAPAVTSGTRSSNCCDARQPTGRRAPPGRLGRFIPRRSRRPLRRCAGAPRPARPRIAGDGRRNDPQP